MTHLLSLLQQLLTFRWQRSRGWRFGLSVFLGFGITVVLLATRATASETVLLQSRDLRVTVPFTEIQALANNGELSPALTEFFQQAPEPPEDVRKWLTAEIAPGMNASLPGEFTMLQLNKTLGEPLGREDLEAIATALRQSYQDDSKFTILEIIENYPRSNVRLVLNRLEQVYTDVNLFVTRIKPVLDVANLLLPELVCDCAVSSPPPPEDGETTQTSRAVTTNQHTLYAQTHQSFASLLAIANQTKPRASELNDPLSPLNKQARASAANKRLVFTLGPVEAAISVADLARFVDTGELSRAWRFYLRLAGISQADLRMALSQPVAIDLRSLDKNLNSLPGEYLLYQVGQIIHPPSKHANIQALRSTMILSTADDNQFSALELLQNYPTQEIRVEAARLARMGRNISRIAPAQGDGTATVIGSAALELEGWLLQLQASIAETVCDCEAIDRSSVIDAPIPQVAAATVSQFLPPDWQPIAPHREKRGNIQVVWLQGTPYDMGYQHGQMLHDEIVTIGADALRVAGFVGKGLGFGRLAEKRTYPNVIEECQGMVAATQDIGIDMDVCLMMSYADVFQEILGYTLPRELFWDGCNQFVATTNATIDGRLYHGSSVDNNEKPIDYVVNNPVVFVRQPTEGLPHVFVTYPGVVWPNSGMNVAGISLGLDTAHPNSPDELEIYGRSNVQIMAKILETSVSFDEARAAMESQPRVRANLIMITDGKSRQAGVFEFTGKNLGVRELQDNGVLYTTNHFVLPEMHDKQPLPVESSSLSRFDRFKQLMEPEGSTTHYGQIDPQIMATIARDRVNPYTGETSPLSLFDDDASPGGNGSLRQALYDPEGLRLWVAAGPPPVPENPFVCFSMGELLGLPNATPCSEPSM
ncbi:MAG: alpha/beta hydrolase [Leptolyngbyaceae cyanobacterium SL_7_1]|nr:alpha/beta hydrolase [Leptolyngbyaceae cyanobacterium SL_7_1]